MTEAPLIDGVVGEEEWAEAASVEGFVQVRPDYGQAAGERTVVLVGYTTESLYVAFRCFDTDPERISAAVTSRDGSLDDDDSVAVLVDTFNDRRTAYFFATNTLSVQLDGKVADNGRTVDAKWDAAWRCASSRTADGWTAELAIPFAILKLSSGDDVSWGINFHRHLPRRLETSVWAGPKESEWRVSAFGTLAGLTLPRGRSKSWELIPYAMATAEEGGERDLDAGVDLRLRLASTLVANLTLNPDFALVEADVEQINLTRFELFVPEKRPFFLEGSEMFEQRIVQFYSRRIGDISWGGKLSGKACGWDVAALGTRADVQTGDPRESGGSTRPADYTVLRLQRGVFGSSTVGLLAANRETAGENTGSVGIDATLFFTDTLGLTAQLIRSHGPENDGSLAWFLRPSFDSANSHFHVRYTNLDDGLMDNMNTIGFLGDDDRKEVDSNLEHTFWFSDSAVERLKGEVNYNRYWGQDGVLRAWELEADAELVFSNHWEYGLSWTDQLEVLDEEFRNSLLELEVGWDNRTGRSTKLAIGSGTNYKSDLALASLETELRLSAAWNLTYELTWLELDPDPDNESTWIHALRTSYHFHNDLYLKLFAQTNSVIDKESIQVLLVWRFLPPFGSLQLAYQRGTSELGERSEQGNSVFSKLSWVF